MLLSLASSVLLLHDIWNVYSSKHACNLQAALVDILKEHGGLSAKEAADVLAQMVTQQRYVRDIWS